MLRPRFTGAFKKDRKRAGRRGMGKDFRECHIAPDWLLIYRTHGEDITFVRTGTHADLFDE